MRVPTSWKRWAWPCLSGMLTLALGWTLWTNYLLRQNAALCNRVVSIQDEWCDGLRGVNQVCEAALVDVAARLGLDTEWMPLVTTSLWRRATLGMSIRKARSEMGAPAWQRSPPLAWPQADGGEGIEAGIGGGTEADERALQQRKPVRSKKR